MAQVTRLGASGVPRSPYGNFSGKSQQTEFPRTYTETWTRLGASGIPRHRYGDFAGKSAVVEPEVVEPEGGGVAMALLRKKRAKEERLRQYARMELERRWRAYYEGLNKKKRRKRTKPRLKRAKPIVIETVKPESQAVVDLLSTSEQARIQYQDRIERLDAYLRQIEQSRRDEAQREAAIRDYLAYLDRLDEEDAIIALLLAA